MPRELPYKNILASVSSFLLEFLIFCDIIFNKYKYEQMTMKGGIMDTLKIIFAILVCIPLAVVVFLCLKNLVKDIDKK